MCYVKKIITSLVLVIMVMATSASCFARSRYYYNPNFSLRFGVGTTSEISTFNYLDGSDFRDYYLLESYFSGYNGYVYTSGAYSVGLDYHLAKWVSFSIDLNADFHWKDLYSTWNDTTPSKTYGAAISILPSAKFYPINRPLFRLYGSLGIGVTKYFGYDSMTTSVTVGTIEDPVTFVTDHSTKLTGQITPLGIEVGRKVFGFVEFGYGCLFTGVRAGVGVNF